jgi:hypothetical protein
MSNTKIQLIIVRDSQGELIACFAPNHIGSTAQKLLDEANEMAKNLGGVVQTKYVK